MWLKEVIVDGFKSYATRTVIGQFDRAFTAITGLNGTGKSNILDAICFVLGITTLSQVRAGSLSELVYKQGQSGVTSATVTLIFDNSDTSSSPAGYEDQLTLTISRQIIIGGKNKYLINGHTAQLKRVTDLFHSVGLNVNNANFLIMQGRITKVINMKPIELLSLIEETAGTSMFENKKEAALKTIEKKQSKLTEIHQVLTNEITPTIQQLRDDQHTYILYRQKQQLFETQKRLVTAYSYQYQQQVIKAITQQKKELLSEMKTKEEEAHDIDRESTTIEQTLAQLIAGIDQESIKALQALEHTVNEHSKQVVKSTSIWQNNQDTIKNEMEQQRILQQSLITTQQQYTTQQQQVKKLEEECSLANNKLQTVIQQIAASRSRELGIDTSASSSDNKEASHGGFNGQLMSLQKSITQTESEIQQKQLQVNHLKTSIKEKSSKMQQHKIEYDNIEKQCHKKRQEIQQIEQKIKNLSFDVEKRSSLESEVSALEEECQQLKSSVNQLAAKLSRFDFNYTAPSATFDKKTVKGCVAAHIDVTIEAAGRAIETTAGSRLFNVIVDNEEIGKQVLEKGQLKHRVTILPLNKISYSTIPNTTIQQAQQLVGKDNVHTALDCISYPEEVSPAMKHVFGSTLITPNNEQASKVSFHPKVAKKTVSYEGDVVDPRGTMEGGAVNQSMNWLSQLAILKQQRTVLKTKEAELAKKQSLLNTMNQQHTTLTTLTTQFDQSNHELSLLIQQQQSTDYAYIQTEVTQLSTDQKSLEEETKVLKTKLTSLKKECNELEQQIADMENQKGSAMANLKAEIERLQQQQITLKQDYQDKQQKHQRCQLETAAIQEEIQQIQQQIQSNKEMIAKLTKEAESFARDVNQHKTKYDGAAHKLKTEQDSRAEQNKEIIQLQGQQKRLIKEKKEIEKAIKVLNTEINQKQQEIHDGEQRLNKWQKEHTWINKDKAQFGRIGGDYDFSVFNNIDEATSSLAALQDEVNSLGSNLNKKALGSLEKAELEYTELMTKKEIVEKDKEKIQQVILSLEEKKRIAVMETWKKVNNDFGAIMSALLPGVFCALQPLDAEKLQLGIEMKVSFNGIWKDSLSELSGGQRSLLALSFILALLLFKPAPMYILDEIDSALDLSHTQNIGMMLKQHFPQSQFIIVSLKEGMFNNANVLFRTQFIQGVSTVTRTEMKKIQHKDSNSNQQQHTRNNNIQDQEQNKENARPNRRR